MPVTFMGLKPGVGPVLKVMANNADNPITTPNSDVEKFLFNSEDRDYVYIKNVTRIEWNAPGWVNNQFTLSNFASQNNSEAIQQSNYFDIVFVGYNGWQYERGWYKYANSPARYQSRFWLETWHRLPIFGDPTCRWLSKINDPTNLRSMGGYFLVVEWELPVGIWARPQLPAAQSISGQRVLEISTARCALAAPGYDVRTATDAQTIFSNTRRVVGCIASGEITLSGTFGSVSIPPLPGANYFVDLQWNEPGQDRRVPYFREGSADIFVACSISGSTLSFQSVVSNVTITYHVYAFGDGPIDTTSPVRLVTTEAGVMIWRGPAGGPVSFKDIIFDSRMHYPRVVYDFLFNAQEQTSYWGPATFSFPSRGYRPIIKSAAFGLTSFSGGLNSIRHVVTPVYDTVGTGTGYATTVTPSSVSFGMPSSPASAETFYSLSSASGIPNELRGRGVRMYALSV